MTKPRDSIQNASHLTKARRSSTHEDRLYCHKVHHIRIYISYDTPIAKNNFSKPNGLAPLRSMFIGWTVTPSSSSHDASLVKVVATCTSCPSFTAALAISARWDIKNQSTLTDISIFTISNLFLGQDKHITYFFIKLIRLIAYISASVIEC